MEEMNYLTADMIVLGWMKVVLTSIVNTENLVTAYVEQHPSATSQPLEERECLVLRSCPGV